jgi:hypothetical protein
MEAHRSQPPPPLLLLALALHICQHANAVFSLLLISLSSILLSMPTCEEHGPSHDGDEEVARLADELERPLQVEQAVDVLQPAKPTHQTGNSASHSISANHC